MYKRLIELCADICRRNGKTKLLWLGDKAKTMAYNPAPEEMILTVHRWFFDTACPGDWMMNRMGDLAQQVTATLADETTEKNTKTATDTNAGNKQGAKETAQASTPEPADKSAQQTATVKRLAHRQRPWGSSPMWRSWIGLGRCLLPISAKLESWRPCPWRNSFSNPATAGRY